eukprot:726172-Prymnesium_polylepis.2
MRKLDSNSSRVDLSPSTMSVIDLRATKGTRSRSHTHATAAHSISLTTAPSAIISSMSVSVLSSESEVVTTPCFSWAAAAKPLSGGDLKWPKPYSSNVPPLTGMRREWNTHLVERKTSPTAAPR